MATAFKATTLSPTAVEVLGQLFTSGPTWDGNVASKAGRGLLFDAGLAFRVEGFISLTQEGLRAAIEWDQRKDRNGKWYCKQNDIPWPRKPR